MRIMIEAVMHPKKVTKAKIKNICGKISMYDNTGTCKNIFILTPIQFIRKFTKFIRRNAFASYVGSESEAVERR